MVVMAQVVELAVIGPIPPDGSLQGQFVTVSHRNIAYTPGSHTIAINSVYGLAVLIHRAAGRELLHHLAFV
jgi:hypothetical protein